MPGRDCPFLLGGAPALQGPFSQGQARPLAAIGFWRTVEATRPHRRRPARYPALQSNLSQRCVELPA